MIATDVVNDRILTVLPLFYVGWSDSVLSPSEMRIIHQEIAKMSFLTKEDKAYLKKWTDPSNPPPDHIFKEWLSAIQSRATELDLDGKSGLIDLGIKIGHAGNTSHTESPDTVEALKRLENALVIDNPHSAGLLLNKLSPHDSSSDCDCSFDVEELKNVLDGDSVETKDRMRELLRDPIFELKNIPDKEIYRLRILEQVKALAEQGVSAYSFPKKYGGGERHGDHIAVFEMLAYNDLSLTIKFGVQFGLFGGAVYLLGTDIHHRKYLEAMHTANLLGCFAMTETGHGSNVKGLHTTATYDPATDEIIVHSPNPAAGKEYIGNAMHSEMAAVFAQLIVNGENHGVHAVLVPLRDKENNLLPGVDVKDCGYKLGLNGVDNGRIWFDQVRVPRENLLNKYGNIDEQGQYSSPISNPSKRFFTMLGALVVGRICVGLAGLSAAKKGLSIATKYALQRRQFGPKDDAPESFIIDYPTHMERLIPAIAKTYAYDFALHDLAKLQVNDDGSDTRKIETLAAGLKSKATWHATDTIQTCREACGGKGYLKENQFADLKADSDIFTTFEGDNTVLMQLVAKGVLTEFKQSFHDDGSLAVIKFLLRKANYKLSEYSYLEKRNTDYKHLTSFYFIKEAFEFRYEKTLIKLSERMRKYLGRKMDPYQAFLKTQVHMVDLADAYIDKITLKSMYQKIEGSDDSVKPILTRLYQCYGLDTIQNNKGWYLENEFFEGNKSKAIRKVRSKIIQDLRPDIEGLVDAFGIPDELIAAPIAFQDFS